VFTGWAAVCWKSVLVESAKSCGVCFWNVLQLVFETSWKLEALSPLLHAYSTMPPLHSSLLVKITWRGLSCQHGVLGFFSFHHLYCPLFKTRSLSSGIVSILCHLWMPLSFFLCCCCFVCFHLTVLMSLQCSQECCHFWFENLISKWLYFCLCSVSAYSWGSHFHLENSFSPWEFHLTMPVSFAWRISDEKVCFF